jgi:hypothetical protein
MPIDFAPWSDILISPGSSLDKYQYKLRRNRLGRASSLQARDTGKWADARGVMRHQL